MLHALYHLVLYDTLFDLYRTVIYCARTAFVF